ncbi:MAG: rubrerythrin [Christensenellales bacterium]
MDLNGSKTLQNLVNSFAGECQAHNRYKFYAEMAQNDGYFYVGNMIKEIADNELAHSKLFFDHIQSGLSYDAHNLLVNAGYPFVIGATDANMRFSEQAEMEEHTSIYPDYAKVAQEEGFAAIASSFQMIAAVEGLHQRVFCDLATQLSDGSLYRKATPTQWKCYNCAYVHESTEAWSICPLCKHPQGFVIPDIDMK